MVRRFFERVYKTSPFWGSPMVHKDSMVAQGALASYGATFRLMGDQTAKLVAKILKGAKPSERPIQTPDTMLLTINLTTAKAIGLELPRSVLERADRLEAVRKLMSNKSIAYKSLKVWQEIDCPVSLFLALPRI
jgi:ABC-type uncharacterized transport system substrate-binding protein